MNDPFVFIKTLFNNSNRNINDLAKIYDDLEYLENELRYITKDYFNKSTIQGKRILIKPNWVKHNTRKNDELCLTTHFSFIHAFVNFLTTLNPAKITIGDAPIQGCKWDRLIPEEFLVKIAEKSNSTNIPIEIKDFRRVKFDPLNNVRQVDVLGLEDFMIFDLGAESYLEPITTGGKNKFRVTQYDPDRFLESHRLGMHKYCITNEIFDADVIISLPKLKTHQKAGITAALKNIVGINGDKDFLPHHRIGGTEMGGDSYPGGNYLRLLAEKFYDISYKNQGGKMFRFWTRLGSLTWILSFPRSEHQPGAAWHGNDTVWRMVMDLNKIIIYGNMDGTINKKPVRELFSLGDGIIGGQGDGPLNPDPLPLGIITFTNNSGWHDIAVSEIMQFDHDKISLLIAAKVSNKGLKVNLFLNNERVALQKLKEISLKTIPPPGWVDFFKSNLENKK